MAKFYSDKEIADWRKRVGFKTTRQAMDDERRARDETPTARVISAAEAEAMAASAGQGGEGNRMDKLFLLLEAIERNTRGIGDIG